MWQILNYPENLSMTCEHEIDTCTSCLQAHILSQIKQLGPLRCDELSCPSLDCRRRLTCQEIRLYAQQDPFETYGHYLVLKHFSDPPNFRWCSGDKCKNGQIFEGMESYVRQKWECESCHAMMCYRHDVPWHDEQSCTEFETTRGEEEANEEWLQNKTKKCTGKDVVSISKRTEDASI